MASKGKLEFCEPGSPLRSAFEVMFIKGELTDLTVKIGGKCFRCHRTILAAMFPYFMTLFKGSSNGGEIVTLRNIDTEAFECLLNFAYTGRINVVRERVKKLLIAANYLQHTNIRETCLKFLSGEFTPENVLDLRTIGKIMKCVEFVKQADTFISEKFELVRKTQAFLDVPHELLIEILSRDDLKVKKPENVHKAISKWLKAHPERTNKFTQLVTFVRKQLPLPFKRCTKEDKMNGTSKKHIPLALSDTPYNCEDAFGIYTVSISSSFKRNIDNYNCYRSSWSKIAEHDQPRSFTTVVSACGLIFAFTGDGLQCFNGRFWTTRDTPWEVKTRSGNVVSRGREIYWFPNIRAENNPVWCFNVETHEWQKQATSLKLISPGLVSLGEFIYVLGGFTSYGVTNEAMTYDPYYEEFKGISPMWKRRSSAGCAALNNKVYVCGGYGSQSLHLESAEVYDPSEKCWQHIKPMTKKWSYFSIVPCEGKLFLIGRKENAHYSMEIYDPEKNAWKSGTDFPDSRKELKAVVLTA